MYPSASHIMILDPASVFICAFMAAAFMTYVATCGFIALYHLVESAISNYKSMTFHRLSVVEEAVFEPVKAVMLSDYGPETKKYTYQEVA